MSSDLGQNQNVWTNEWKSLSPESEIRMWDFYGLRNWILKFTPRFGKTIEAGCGLGRYVFFLSELGIDIEGVDFSGQTIDFLNDWKRKNNPDVLFKEGNVLNLDYSDNSLSGYISLGVIEHFIEGPQKVLQEAHRVLRPGGIAIITTPNISFSILKRNFKNRFKNIVKRLLLKKITEEPFYQYWYTPAKLKKFVEESGLKVTIGRGADLLFAFYENSYYSEEKIKEGSFGYRFSAKNEDTYWSKYGAQSLTISVKLADLMHCFLCGKIDAKPESLDKYDIPLCSECCNKKEANFYIKSKIPKFSLPYLINPPIKTVSKCKCEFCDNDYFTDEIFEDYGFSKNVCKACLKIPEINFRLSNEFVKPVWRKRM